jgi:hypothetical protein
VHRKGNGFYLFCSTYGRTYHPGSMASPSRAMRITRGGGSQLGFSIITQVLAPRPHHPTPHHLHRVVVARHRVFIEKNVISLFFSHSPPRSVWDGGWWVCPDGGVRCVTTWWTGSGLNIMGNEDGDTSRNCFPLPTVSPSTHNCHFPAFILPRHACTCRAPWINAVLCTAVLSPLHISCS